MLLTCSMFGQQLEAITGYPESDWMGDINIGASRRTATTSPGRAFPLGLRTSHTAKPNNAISIKSVGNLLSRLTVSIVIVCRKRALRDLSKLTLYFSLKMRSASIAWISSGDCVAPVTRLDKDSM